MTSHRDGRRRSPARNVLGARNDKKVQKHRKATPSTSEPRRGVTITYKAAPPGFIYVPLGTPELAQRCKELSQQLQYPWKFVNALPTSRVVTDPAKISFHIQRIGYHFSTRVVDQACQELEYQLVGREYVTKKDLEKREHDATIAKAMEKIGYTAAKPTDSIEKVNAVILELFPCIPDHDRLRVLEHSFNPGTDRVGSMSGDLARRVQLGVVASIRHNHTDYDSLLKTFRDWNKARHEVEPVTLQKVIEWRGELQPGQQYIVEDADLSSSSDEQAKPARSRSKKETEAARKRDAELLYDGDSDLADGSWHVSDAQLTRQHANQWLHVVETTSASPQTPQTHWQAESHRPAYGASVMPEMHARRAADSASTGVVRSIERDNGIAHDLRGSQTDSPRIQASYYSAVKSPYETIEEQAAAWARYHAQKHAAELSRAINQQPVERRHDPTTAVPYHGTPATQPQYAGIQGQTQPYASYQGQRPVQYAVPHNVQTSQYAGNHPLPYSSQGPPAQYPGTQQRQPLQYNGSSQSATHYTAPQQFGRPTAYTPTVYPPQPAYPPADDRRAYERY